MAPKHWALSEGEQRINGFHQFEPILAKPGTSAWAVLKYRLQRLFFVDILSPSTIFAIITTDLLYRWDASKCTTVETVSMMFLYLLAWLLCIRRSEAVLLLQALATMIKSISIRWSGSAGLMATADLTPDPRTPAPKATYKLPAPDRD